MGYYGLVFEFFARQRAELDPFGQPEEWYRQWQSMLVRMLEEERIPYSQ